MEETQDGAGVVDGSSQIGECHGGPWNGKSAMSRFAKGFLLVDKAANRCWVYDWNGSAYLCRDEEPRVCDYDKRFEAAESTDWDVISFVGGDAK